jgi:hypothetical protein
MTMNTVSTICKYECVVYLVYNNDSENQSIYVCEH